MASYLVLLSENGDWGGEIAVVRKGGNSVESPEVGRIKTAITLHHGTLSRRLRCQCKGCTIRN